MPGPATYDPDYPVRVARSPGDVDPDAIQNDDELPETLDEFLEASETEECQDCGSLVRPRFVEDGRCMGCQYGNPQGGDAGGSH